MTDFGKKRYGIEYGVNTLKSDKKLLLSAASKITKRKEQIPDIIKGLNDEYLEDIVDVEKLREITFKKLQQELETLLEEYGNVDNQEALQRLDKEYKQTQGIMQTINKEKCEAESR